MIVMLCCPRASRRRAIGPATRRPLRLHLLELIRRPRPRERSDTATHPRSSRQPDAFAVGSSSGQSALVTALALPPRRRPSGGGDLRPAYDLCPDPAVSLATVTLGDEAPQNRPTVGGVVEFQGTPCPGASCAVDMTYQLDLAPSVLAALRWTEITDVRAVGAVGPQAIVLNANGEAEMPPGDADLGTRHRIDSGLCMTEQELQASFVGTNVDAVAVAVDWASKTCTVNGTLLGTTTRTLTKAARR